MKRSLTILLLASLTTISLMSQETTTPTETYCMIIGTKVPLKKKVTVQIDFGDGINQWKPRESTLLDADGKPMKFESMIDALNYMGARGWQFVDAYSAGSGGDNIYHWIMKRPVTSEDHIPE